MRKRTYHGNWVLRMAAVLLVLVLFTTHISTGLYARYTTSSEISDQARVAIFQVDRTGTLIEQNIEVQMSPGEKSSYDILIDNKSEVAIQYKMAIVNKTNNLPLTFSVLQGEDPLTGNENVFVGEVGIGAKKGYGLIIHWPEKSNNPDFMGMVDLVTVTMTAEQID